MRLAKGEMRADAGHYAVKWPVGRSSPVAQGLYLYLTAVAFQLKLYFACRGLVKLSFTCIAVMLSYISFVLM